MSTATTQEETLVRSFIAPERRQRFLQLLQTPRGRARFIKALRHFHDLDPRYAHRFPPRQQKEDEIFRLLTERGAPPMCYVVGTSPFDGSEVSLREALAEVFDGSSGNFLSCVPGRLAYFGGEDIKERYILIR